MADQADGLRRLLSPRGTRVLGLIGSGRRAGASTATANLAAALARRGRSVIILDEQGSRHGAGGLLGGTPARTLGEALAGRAQLADVIAEPLPGVRVLNASDLTSTLRAGARVADIAPAMADLLPEPDAILIDAGTGAGTDRVTLALAAGELAIVLAGNAHSLKDGYALIKLLSRAYARRQFQIVVGRAEAQEAATQFSNLRHTCARYLGVSPVLLGCVPRDEQLATCGRLGRPVNDAFPESPAAAAFRSIAEIFDGAAPQPADGGRYHPVLRLLTQSSRLLFSPATVQ